MEIPKPIDTTMIMGNPTSTDGFAVVATLTSTKSNTGHGERDYPARFKYSAKASKAERGEGNDWPTVKPIALMRYLCRLVTPPGGIIVDPFMGSGSTGIAAIREGFMFVGIDDDEHACEIATKRLSQEVLL